jgi:hypothetical protein
MANYRFDLTVAVRQAKQLEYEVFDLKKRRVSRENLILLSLQRKPSLFMNALLYLPTIAFGSVSFDEMSTKRFWPTKSHQGRGKTFREQRIQNLAQIIHNLCVAYYKETQQPELRDCFEKYFVDHNGERISGTPISIIEENFLKKCFNELRYLAAASPDRFKVKHNYSPINIAASGIVLSDRKTIARHLVVICRFVHRNVINKYKKSHAWADYYNKSCNVSSDSDDCKKISKAQIERIKHLLTRNKMDAILSVQRASVSLRINN